MNNNLFRRPSVIIAIVMVTVFSLTHLVSAKKADVSMKSTDKNIESKIKETKNIKDISDKSQEKSVASNVKDVSLTDSIVSNIKLAIGIDDASTIAIATTSTVNYSMHSNITTTLFWAGEEADKDNKDISNLPSAWDEKWVKHFGGVDTPKKRNGLMPSGFIPSENPFYFALPYNDFDEDGNRKEDIENIVPWAKEKTWKDTESMLKNRWIKIIKGNKVAYAQWEDVGPFKEDDSNYVFGGADPQSKTNKHAGLDVSPAVNSVLGLEDIDTTSWQFIDAVDVPDGPWKNIVTTSQTFWK